VGGGHREAVNRTHVEWKNRVAAEYRSSAITAQVLHLAIQCGFPDELLRTALRIVGDELDHARLSHECLVALGGDDAPAALDVTSLAVPAAAEGPLASLLDLLGANFCLGETFAVPLFARMREGTTHPAARDVLDRVLRDEAVHRAFGWDALDVVLAIDPDGARARMASRLPGWLAAFRRSYGTPRDVPPITAAERAAGLIDLAEYVAIHDDTVANDIAGRFARRGIACQVAVSSILS
jgi:hypothetical protein